MDGNRGPVAGCPPRGGGPVSLGVRRGAGTRPARRSEPGSLTKMEFGKTPDGTPVDLYVLKNGRSRSRS